MPGNVSVHGQFVSTIQAKTASYTWLANSDNGTVISSKGAAGTITISMPAATVGMRARFYVGAAQELRIDPNGTEQICLPSNGVPGAAGKWLVADAIGETVTLECCETGIWAAMGYTGTWTAEA